MQDFEHLKGKNVLVTGGTGDVGSLIVQFLCNQVDVNVNVLARKTSPLEKISHVLDKLKIVYGDFLDYDSIEASVLKIKPNIIFHLAAQSTVSTSIKYPLQEFDINVRGTLFILELARKVDAKVVFSSSGMVYGEPLKIPIREEDPKNPISPHGTSKLCCEKYLETYHRTYDLDSVILRYFNIYGPPIARRVVYDIYTKLKNKPDKIQISGTGKEMRDFIFSHDIIEATLLSSKLNGFHAFNVGTGKSTAIVDLVKLISKKLRINSKILLEGQAREGDIQRLVADTNKIYKELGWKAKMPLETGIEKTIEWFKTI